jgi:small basic protein
VLREEIKNIKSEKSDLRKFGISVGIVLGILGGLLWWRGKDYYVYFLIISAVLITLGLVLPGLLKPLQKAWMTLAVTLGWFMTRVILSILFYVVFTTIGLISRLSGRQFLDLKTDNNKPSYWIARKNKPFDKRDYERQF